MSDEGGVLCTMEHQAVSVRTIYVKYNLNVKFKRQTDVILTIL